MWLWLCSLLGDPVQGEAQTCCREPKAGTDLEETPRGTLYLLQFHLGDVTWERGWCCSAGADVSGFVTVMDVVMSHSVPMVAALYQILALPWDQFGVHCWTPHL